MKYEAIEFISKADAETVFVSENPVLISQTLVRLAYHCDDWRWVQSKCLLYSASENENVQNTAILCLGHLARIHHKLDMELIMPVLSRLKKNPKLEGRVEDALSDIDIYIKRKNT